MLHGYVQYTILWANLYFNHLFQLTPIMWASLLHVHQFYTMLLWVR